MNIGEMKKKGDEIAQDMADQIETIVAIKGERYGKALGFMVKAFALNRGVASLMPRPKDLNVDNFMSVIMMAELMSESINALTNMHLQALGFTKEDKSLVKEIGQEAERLIKASLERASAVMQP